MKAVRPREAGSAFDAQARFIAACGGPGAVADHAGVAPFTPYKWTDPDQTRGMPFQIACALTEHFGQTALAEHLAARAGGVFLPLLPDGEGALAELTGEAADGMGRLVREVFAAMSPCSPGGAGLTAAEAATVTAKIDRVMHALAGLRSLAQDAVRGEGGG